MLKKVEWMSDLDVRSLGMVASRMLTNYVKSREREQYEKGEIASEEEEYYDPSYLEVRGLTPDILRNNERNHLKRHARI